MTAGPYSIGSDHWPGLAKVIEECGEVIQAAAKVIAANGDGRHWDGSDLRQRLEDELADAQAAIAFAVDMNGLDSGRILNRAADKLAMFRRWHREHSDGTAKLTGGA
jgi:NTP pyrophosphatase (non-canonical NTP hydrolase)